MYYNCIRVIHTAISMAISKEVSTMSAYKLNDNGMHELSDRDLRDIVLVHLKRYSEYYASHHAACLKRELNLINPLTLEEATWVIGQIFETHLPQAYLSLVIDVGYTDCFTIPPAKKMRLLDPGICLKLVDAMESHKKYILKRPS